MEVSLPHDISDRIPAGHTVHRHTGTMEHVQTNSNTGQRNFILMPLPGEDNLKLTFAGGQRFGVTDLPIEQHNGHPVVLFSIISPSGKIGHFLCYSRANGSWLTLHNQYVNRHLFDQPQLSTGKKLGFLAAHLIGGAKLGNAIGNQMAENSRTLNSGDTHVLILDIRQYLTSIMQQPPQGASSRL